MKKITFLTAILVVSLSFAQVPSYVPTTGLIGWWPFNSNANDESGNGNNGSVNGVTFCNDYNGLTNSAINKSNNGSYIRTQGVINNVYNNFTISVWVNPNQPDTIMNQGITGFEGYGIMSVIHPPHGTTNWGSSVMNAGVGLNVGNNQIQIVEHTDNYIGSPLVYINQIIGWHHIIIVYDQHIPKLYLDGNLVATGLQSTIQYVRPGSGFCNLYTNSGFGSSFSPNGNPIGDYKGDFDDIAIWNRPLTDCEIKNLYNGGFPNSSQTQSALDTYTWPVNNQTYTQSGSYSDTLVNTDGCDSIVTLNLTLSYTGINELTTSTIAISPNPTNGDFSLSGLELFNSISSMTIKDVNGKTIKELDPKAAKFCLGGVQAGVYFLIITTGNKQEVVKIVIE